MNKTLSLLTALAISTSAHSSGGSLVQKDLSFVPYDENIMGAHFVTVLKRDTIQARNAESIADILSLIPGFVSVTPYGSGKVATNGMSDVYPRRVRVEIDGVPVNVASNGSSPAWGAIPVSPQDIDKVVFVHNPSGDFNGTQSVNGVLKLFTVRSGQVDNSVTANVGNRSQKGAYARIVKIINKDLSVQLLASTVANDGSHIEESGTKSDKVMLSGSVGLGEDAVIHFNVGRGVLKSNQDVSDDSVASPIYTDLGETNDVANINIESVNAMGVSNIVVGFNSYSHRLDNELNTLPNVFTGQGVLTPVFNADYDSVRYFASGRHRYPLNRNIELAVRGQWTRDSETPNDFSQSLSKWDTETLTGGFDAIYRASSYSFGAGIGLEHNNLLKKQVKNHSVFATKKLSRKLVASFIYSEGARNPVNWESQSQHYLTIKEIPTIKLTRDNASADGLKSEKVKSASLKVAYKRNPHNTIQARIFKDDYSDLIYYNYEPVAQYTGFYSQLGVPFGAVNTAGSGDSMTVSGVETHTENKLSQNIELITSYSHREIEGHADNVMSRTQSIPKDVVSLGVITDLNVFKFNAFFNWFSPVKWESNAVADPKKSSSGARSLSLSMGKCFTTGVAEEFCLTAYGNNLMTNGSDFYNLEAARLVERYGIQATYNF